ncbi:MAG TPA: DUF5615 family PIN-like protein [Pseudonocardiaceae bacterium]|jgi:hypothetical protein
MKLLLDEDVPVQLVEPLRHLLREHQVDHVQALGWKGKKDRFLLPDASRKGYEALITNDSAQLDNPEETRAIRDSGMHPSGIGMTPDAGSTGSRSLWLR